MSKILAISNRTGLDFNNGKLGAGGLTVGVMEALKAVGGGIWLGWSGDFIEKPEDRLISEKEYDLKYFKEGDIEFYGLPLTKREYDGYYKNVANDALWPYLHEILNCVGEDGTSFDTYGKVNNLFAKVIKKNFIDSGKLEDDGLIWVHDYHLIPLGRSLDQLGVENPKSFFLHTPVAKPDCLDDTILPREVRLQIKDVLDDLYAYDQVGFQCTRDLKNFMNMYGFNTEHMPDFYEPASLQYEGETCNFAIMPISIETEEYRLLAEKNIDHTDVQKIVQLMGKNLVFSAERADYTKGLIKRIEAVSQFFKEYPDLAQEWGFIQIATKTRGDVGNFKDTFDKINRQAGELSGLVNQLPHIKYYYTNNGADREILAGYYRASKVGLVTPLNDGQNLVAKEYVAAQDPHDPGVLVLSREAGAADEFGRVQGAILVNPFDPSNIREGLYKAATMPLEERKAMHNRAYAAIKKNDVKNWACRQLSPYFAELAVPDKTKTNEHVFDVIARPQPQNRTDVIQIPRQRDGIKTQKLEHKHF